MTEKRIKTEEDLRVWIDELEEGRTSMREELEATRALAAKTAQDLVEEQLYVLLGTNRGAERVHRVAEEHGVSVEAAARHLSPKPVNAPKAHELDEGVASDYATWGFSSGEVADLAREKGITKTEAASTLARRSQTNP